jgi:hypothetical protein
MPVRAIRYIYAGLVTSGLIWMWNPFRLVLVRQYPLVGSVTLALALAAMVFLESLFWKKPGWFGVVVKVSAAAIAAYVAFSGIVTARFLAGSIEEVTQAQTPRGNVAVVEISLLIDTCRQFELRTGPHWFERYHHATGCLSGEGPIVRKANDSRYDLTAVFVGCEQVPPKIGQVRIQCEG